MACINQLRTNLPVCVGYELVTDTVLVIDHHPALVDSQSIRRDSGFVRLTLLRDDPNRLWIDTDVKLISWPEIEEGIPHIFAGSCPAAILYLGGLLKERIDKILNEFAKTDLMCIHHWLYALDPHKMIPESCFEHLKLSNCKE
jgi:hypothetical protein